MTLRSLATLALAAVAAATLAQGVDPELFGAMKWRQVGPYRGGRSLAVAGSVQRPKEYYFGATGGGIWKTTDGGANWSPVADDFLTSSSVGAIAIAPSNPDIVVAGTGERDIRGNISYGDGLYRTLDGGKTWQNIGLKDSDTISRIVIHPTDPETMWVASLGHVYGVEGPNVKANRGVYRTTDGGKTWSLVLPGFEKAGAVDLVIDPSDPKVLLAATWEAWRTPYALNSGGKGSRLFKSVDGGETWTDITDSPGLPKTILGKTGLTISPVDPMRYYAQVEAEEGGLFRSDDAGATWERVNDSRNWRQRAWYYSHVYADPKDKDTVYILNVGFARSKDGGKTFQGVGTPHSDNHDLWIAPDDPKRMIEANDGGANVTTDGGSTWTDQEIPTAQIYHVTTDDAFPYRILGAQQDNSTIRIASRTFGPGIGKSDWTGTAGGESGYVAAQPGRPNIVYGGNYGGDLSRFDHGSNLSRSVDPWPDNPMGHGAADAVHRFQWTYPIVFSPNDPKTLYTCSQYVLKTTNEGQTWQRISPDLTRNEVDKQAATGGPITKDNTSVEYYGTVFTLAESPKRKGVIWAGSDDGLIHVTQNGGRSWTDVTPKGMPTYGLVSMIEASPHDPAVAFAAVDNHKNDDRHPYAYMTRDYGKTWTPIMAGLPEDAHVHVVREDKRRPGLLYAGTETGIWISFDAGEHWQSLRLNLPVTPVHDLTWKDDDLVIATHGRGFWVLDDISPLQQFKPGKPSAPTLFAPRPTWRVRFGSAGRGEVGANPPSGILLNYYLPAETKDLTFELKDKSGRISYVVTAPSGTAGAHREAVWPSEASWSRPTGMIFWAGGSSRVTLPAGEYTVAMRIAGREISKSEFRFVPDPRTGSTEKDLQEQYWFLKTVAGRITAANNAVQQVRTLREALTKAKTPEVPADLTTKIDALIVNLTSVEEAIYQTKLKSGQDPLNYPIRLNDKLSGVFSVASNGDYAPTDGAKDAFAYLDKQLRAEEARLAKCLDDLTAINLDFRRLGLPEIPSK